MEGPTSPWALKKGNMPNPSWTWWRWWWYIFLFKWYSRFTKSLRYYWNTHLFGKMIIGVTHAVASLKKKRFITASRRWKVFALIFMNMTYCVTATPCGSGCWRSKLATIHSDTKSTRESPIAEEPSVHMTTLLVRHPALTTERRPPETRNSDVSITDGPISLHEPFKVNYNTKTITFLRPKRLSCLASSQNIFQGCPETSVIITLRYVTSRNSAYLSSSSGLYIQTL